MAIIGPEGLFFITFALVLSKLSPIFSVSRWLLGGLRFWQLPSVEQLESLLPKHKRSGKNSIHGVPKERLRNLGQQIGQTMDFCCSGILDGTHPQARAPVLPSHCSHRRGAHSAEWAMRLFGVSAALFECLWLLAAAWRLPR